MIIMFWLHIKNNNVPIAIYYLWHMITSVGTEGESLYAKYEYEENDE